MESTDIINKLDLKIQIQEKITKDLNPNSRINSYQCANLLVDTNFKLIENKYKETFKSTLINELHVF